MTDTARILPSFRFTVVLETCSLEIWAGGFCRFDRHPTNHRHIHTSYHELCLVTAGKGVFSHNGRTVAINTGDIFISELNAPHEISSLRTRNLELVFLCLTISRLRPGQTPGPEAAVVERFLRGHAPSAPGGGRMEPWLEIMCLGTRGAFAVRRCEQAARMFVIEAMDILAPGADTSVTPAASPDTYSRAVDFIERNVRRQFGIEELARYCCCSSRHLRRVFTARTGRALVDAINERRMRLAAQDLLMRFTAGQVAQSLGFSSAAHFSRLFTRYHGLTPKRFQILHAPKSALPKTVFE